MKKKINCFVNCNYDNGAPDRDMITAYIDLTTAAGDRHESAPRLATIKEHETAAAAAIQLLWTGATAMIVDNETGEIVRTYAN